MLRTRSPQSYWINIEAILFLNSSVTVPNGSLWQVREFYEVIFRNRMVGLLTV
jgi:hypothetical protein